MLSYAPVVLAVLLALGQAEQRDQTDDFKKLRGFMGTWEAKDVEAEGEAGDVLVSWKPILEGKFIEHRFVFKPGADNGELRGVALFGRDPADGNVHGWGFDNQGGVMAMELTGWDGKKSTWSTTFSNADGTTGKSEANEFELLDKNSYRWMLAIAGGDKSEAVFRRVRPKRMSWPERQYEAREGLSDQMSEMSWWTGDYTFDGSDAFTKKASAGFSTCGWVLAGNFLQYDIASVDSDLKSSRYRAIMGIDPATGKTTGWEFESTGTVGKYTISNKGQDVAGEAVSPEAGLLEFKGKMTKNADGLQYEASGNLPNGNRTTYSGVWKKLK